MSFEFPKDRIEGAMLGYAVGDALGLGTEFMTVAEARRRYPQGLSDYSQIIRDAHRSQWRRGDWTNDTEIMMRVTRDIIDHDGINLPTIAGKLIDWFHEDPVDMPLCMRWCCLEENYTADPIGTALDVWTRMGDPEPRNEALGRSLFGAMLRDNMERDTLSLVNITHCGAACSGTALVIGRVAHDLLWEGKMTGLDDLERLCRAHDRESLPALRLAYGGSLEELELDDPKTLWHTRKTMMAALWTLWHCNSFQETLDTVIMAAGDADTNGAMALSLAGMRYGAHTIPRNLIGNLLRHDELLAMADEWTAYLEKRLSH